MRVGSDEPARRTGRTWYGLEGWATPLNKPHRSVWHFWRHGRTSCGAYRWDPALGAPRLLADIPVNDRRGACARCLSRAVSRHRRFHSDLSRVNDRA